MACSATSDSRARQRSLVSRARAVLDNRSALDYVLAAQGGPCAIANASCWINSAFQVESETTKLLKLAKSLKGHSSFTASAISWLG